MTSAELRKRATQARLLQRRDDARRDLQEAVAQARANGDHAELALALNALGQIERDDGHLVDAMACYEEIIALQLEQAHPLAVAHAIRHLGDIHRENDCPEVAGLCYQEALGVYSSNAATPPLDFANALRSFAIHKQEAGECAAATQLWQATREIYAALGIDAGVKECERRLGDLESTAGSSLRSE